MTVTDAITALRMKLTEEMKPILENELVALEAAVNVLQDSVKAQEVTKSPEESDAAAAATRYRKRVNRSPDYIPEVAPVIPESDYGALLQHPKR